MQQRPAASHADHVCLRDAALQLRCRSRRYCRPALLALAMVLWSADAQALTADFVADRSLGTPPFTVSFQDTSSGTPTGWAWYFGDEDLSDRTWTEMTDDAGWSERSDFASVALPDGSLVVMGGWGEGLFGGTAKRDVWRSTDQGANWEQVTSSADWPARYRHNAVALPDGAIVIMGGLSSLGFYRTDVWRSTDQGATWEKMTAAVPWQKRTFFTATALSDGGIVIMGGRSSDGLRLRDVWHSADQGATWTQKSAAASWSARLDHAAAALPDGSIVLMGGQTGSGLTNDVWRSTNRGATWTLQTGIAEWSPRRHMAAATVPDGSLMLMGGRDGVGWPSDFRNDVWRSTDQGATWQQMSAAAAWTARVFHCVVKLPDGSIVLMGGSDGVYRSDVWRLETAASTEQHPEYTYEETGVFGVTLLVRHATGFDVVTQKGAVTVTHTPPPPEITAVPTLGTAPLTVQFSGETSAEDTIGWAWYFGDDDLSGRNWTRRTASAGWTARKHHVVATLPDGSLVLMGGDDTNNRNDVWRSADGGANWTEVAAAAEWAARHDHTAVALPDGNLVLMGGDAAGTGLANDVWRSTDQGATWTQRTSSAPWAIRHRHAAVALSDGSLVLMGGYAWPGGIMNDVWRSTDQGATWTQRTAAAPWPARNRFAAVVLSDDSIVIMGHTGYRDVWRSADQGATWTQMTDAAPWPARDRLAAVCLPDDSILMFGGQGSTGRCHDVWRSTDQGATWSLTDDFPAWTGRYGHAAAVLPDGSVTLMGGMDAEMPLNDVWRLATAGADVQHPEHTYTEPGAYAIALQAYGPGGYSSIREPSRIVVTFSAPAFEGAPTEGPAPLEVAFTDQTAWEPTGWAWYFGETAWAESGWTLQTAEAPWSARVGHRAAVRLDGGLFVMGGRDNQYRNDVWRSLDQGITWEAVTANADWRRRGGHAVATLPDGSLVVMGGSVAVPGGHDGAPARDVWRSLDQGVTWEERTAAAGWAARMEHAAAVLPDGSLVVMGGTDGVQRYNDVWRSTDQGANWTQMTAAAEWSARSGMAAATLPDGSLVLLGGFSAGYHSDVWRSTDQGASWTQVSASAGWSARSGLTTAVLPDGTLIVAGGASLRRHHNDVWYSTDQGATWTAAVHADWSQRARHSSMVLPDGSLVVLGGHDGESSLADVWRLPTAGATEQHPVHTYDQPGTYTVTLQAYRPEGAARKQRTAYIDAAYTHPVAAFSGEPTLGQAPLDVQFSDLSKGDVSGWAWYFGDETLTDREWTRQTEGAGWSARRGLAATVLVDGSILVLGGGTRHDQYNDVWRSTDRGASWTQRTAAAGWSARERHAVTTLSDGSVLLTGGLEVAIAGDAPRNDVWRSTDRGASWTQRTAAASWSARWGHALVALGDGGVVVMGGTDDRTGGTDGDGLKNDVWMSTDSGLTWHALGAADWSARSGHAVATLSDDTVILSGGLRWSSKVHALRPIDDVWRSDDGGANWTRQTASAGWPARSHHALVALPDDSLVLLGGNDGDTRYNDVWRSTDRGETWVQLTDDAAWVARTLHAAAALSDGSVALLGGDDGNGKLRDVWRLVTAGSTDQHPQHGYLNPGLYNVTLQVFNPDGANRITRIEYVTVTGVALHTLTYAAGAGGAVNDQPVVTLQVAEGGDGVDIHAQADSGAYFLRWSDGETANPRLDLDVSGDLDVTALFISAAGVPIEWYVLHGLTPGEWEGWHDLDLHDSDGDGALNWEEYIADTDPNNSDCYFRVVTFTNAPPWTVVFTASASRVYTLLGRTNLMADAWQPVPGAGPRFGVDGEDMLSDDNDPPLGPFYRLKVELPEP